MGTMSFGTQWGFGADEETSHQVLDAYRETGGNFLDTANKYHGGETEEIVGRWLKGKRDSTVVATKYSLAMDHDDPNSGGNQRKNLVLSVEESLKRMQTDYIDLLWVHAWDGVTPFEEVMRGLDDVVRAGKVLYVGISDAPAWIVSASNVLAEMRGWTPFVGLQIEYSLLQRTPERDLLPMAEHFDLSVLGWGPLGAGVLTGKYTRSGVDNDSARTSGNKASGRTSDEALAIARQVDRVADELGVTSAQVATAWVISRDARNIPIIGARRVSQVEDTLAATTVSLGDTHLAALNKASEIELGFPHEMLGSDVVQGMLFGDKTRERVRVRPAHR